MDARGYLQEGVIYLVQWEIEPSDTLLHRVYNASNKCMYQVEWLTDKDERYRCCHEDEYYIESQMKETENV